MWQAVDDDRCECGEPRSESFNPENEGAYTAKRWVCFACEAKTKAQNRVSDSDTHRFSYYTVEKEE